MSTTVVTGDLTPEMKTFYNRELLECAVAVFVHGQFGQKRPIPPNSGKVCEFRKFGALSAATTPLTEGVTPSGSSLAVTAITATVAQYGDFVEGSDLLALTAFDPILSETARILGEQAGDTMDQIVRNILAAGTSVQYAAGRADRVHVAAGDNLSSVELRKAIRTLENNKAKRIGDSWVAIVDPYTKYDLMSDAKWEAASEYAGATQMFAGELGRLYGVRFIETTNAKVFSAAGAGSPAIDVHATVILGANAYGVIDLSGQALQFIFKQVGSAGAADPLDQRWTSAWKAAFTAKILNELYMVRIEHAVSS